MSLSAVVLPKQSIRVGETAFDVRGLSFHDLSALFSEMKDDLIELVGMYIEASESGEDPLQGGDAGLVFLKEVITQLPDLAAKVVAIGADEPDMSETVKQLPFPKQLEAVMEIGRLTFEDEDGLKKFMGNVTALFGALSQEQAALPQSD